MIFHGLRQGILQHRQQQHPHDFAASAVSKINGLAIERADTVDPKLNVPEDDVTKCERDYAYVLTVDLAHMRPFVPWWQQDSHQQHWEKREYEAYAWMNPFVSLTYADQLDPLRKAVQRGVRDVKSVPYAFREIIRHKRRNKEPHRDLLQALYGACVLVDFVASLDIECQLFFNDVRSFVNSNDLKWVQCDYLAMGYQHIASLNSTDVKWLVSEFGEPTDHKPYSTKFSPVIQNAVSRFCRAELRRNNREIKTDFEVEQALPSWLHHQFESGLRIHNESQRYAASIQARHDQQAVLGLHRQNGSKRQMPNTASSMSVSGHTDTTTELSKNGADVMPDSELDAEVKARMREFAYILDADLPPLPDVKQWGGFQAHLNCKNEGLDKFHRWLDPFLAPDVAKLTSLKSFHEVGPNETNGIVIALRRLIKSRRKNKLPHDELLHALFGLCLMRDFANSFVVDGIPMPVPNVMVEFVDIDELRAVKCDFASVGYQHCGSLLKTDIQWLVAAFGEPVEHKYPLTLFQYVRHRAISRYCWAELRRLVLSANSGGILHALSMRDWLEGHIKSSIAREMESQAWLAQKEQLAEMAAAAHAATLTTYVIVDLETTALNPETGEIFELSAVRVDPTGAVSAEFSTLIRVNQRIPTFIAARHGIVRTDVNPGGHPLVEALTEFLAFINSNPLFIRHVSINFGFLKKAASQVGLNFSNPVHDISFVLPMDFSADETYPVGVSDAYVVGVSEPSKKAFLAARVALNELNASRIAMRKGRDTIVSQAGVLHWCPSGLFQLAAVGTTYRHDAIAKLAGNLPGKNAFAFCTATLAPENTNIHDANAVKVLIEGEMVGYLPKDYAVVFRSHFEKFGLLVQITTCDAVITNGLEVAEKQYSYTIELDFSLESNAPQFISPTYTTIERLDPTPALSKQKDGRYFVEFRLNCDIFEDADRQWRLMTWTTDHWDNINYYLGNKKNAGLGHLLFAVPKTTHKELFGDKEPVAKLEIVKGRMALVSLKPVT